MTRIKIKNENGEWETMPIIKGEPGEKGIQGEKGDKGDESYPIGTIVEYDGDTIPSGFELVEDNSASVIVSSTEPTTGEEVWLQKGKNLFDGKLEYGTISTSDGELGDATTAIRSVNYIKINQESGYTISNNKNYENIVFYYDEDFNCLGHDRGGSNGVLSFKPKSNTSYIKFRTSTASAQNDLTTLFQLEQGYVATEYEPYTRKIHTKTDNGYEEFYNEENREVYSTSEQRIGTWIDGKPLYRIARELLVEKGNKALFTISDDAEIKKCIGWVKKSESNFSNTLSWGHKNADSTDYGILYYNYNTKTIMLDTSNPGLATIIIEYTKTTD